MDVQSFAHGAKSVVSSDENETPTYPGVTVRTIGVDTIVSQWERNPVEIVNEMVP